MQNLPSLRDCFWTILVLLALSFWSSATANRNFDNDFESPEMSLKLEHGMGHGLEDVTFTPRGVLSILNFKGPKFTAEQKDIDFSMLKDLASQKGFYFLKAIYKIGGIENIFNAFVPAENLVNSGLSDIITIHTSPNSNAEIIAVSYGTTRSDYFSRSQGEKTPSKFNTTLSFHQGEFGPIPDTAPYLEKIEREKMARERGEGGPDNRSFLAKYWMYIVPVLILVLLSGASNPEEGGGGGGGR